MNIQLFNKISSKRLQAVLKKKNYVLFIDQLKPYNLNIIGIRSLDMTPNTFNDLICVLYLDNGVWILKVYPCTTDPGLYFLLAPMNVRGTAIMKEGQYRGAYSIGYHYTYLALTQQKPIDFYIDADRDKEFDLIETTVIHEAIGANIHRASPTYESVTVDNWSAGCQVISDPQNFTNFLEICKKGKANWGDSFTYTLINEKDIDAVIKSEPRIATLPADAQVLTINKPKGTN